MYQRATNGGSSGEEKYYHTSTTYGNKTITCGFKPKIIIVNRSDTTANYAYGCVYAEKTVSGNNMQHAINGGSWQAVGSGTGYCVIGAITDTGFTMSTNYTVSCEVYVWG